MYNLLRRLVRAGILQRYVLRVVQQQHMTYPERWEGDEEYWSSPEMEPTEVGSLLMFPLEI